MISLIVISIYITNTFASEYSLFEYVNTTIKNADHCPPHFYGSLCNIPYCVPGNGNLFQRKTNEYYCKCKHEFLKGNHCQTIDCNDGLLSNITFQCECPEGAYDIFCRKYRKTARSDAFIWIVAAGTIVCLFFLICTANKGYSESYTLPQLESEPNRNEVQRNQNASCGLSRFGDAVRYLVRKDPEEPPHYYDAVFSDEPPVYEDRVNVAIPNVYDVSRQSGSLPTYDSAITIAQPPKYTV